MVRLTNIQIDEAFAQADFYPENSSVCGFIKVDIKTGQTVELKELEAYGKAY